MIVSLVPKMLCKSFSHSGSFFIKVNRPFMISANKMNEKMHEEDTLIGHVESERVD